MKNIRLDVEYDGTDYCGWQRQSEGIPTVQGELERVLSRILQERIVLMAAGRTDRGVHARLQVVNFSTCSAMDLPRLAHACNALLPAAIRVGGPEEAVPGFHARFSAREREYRYFLIEHPSALRNRFTGCSNGVLDLAAMRRAADFLPGVHDFRFFSREPSGGERLLCRITACEWLQENGTLVFRIRANRFLRSMVRYLVGVMIAAGRGRVSPEEFLSALESGMPHRLPQVPAAPNGLFLWDVTY
jgi:tRNA pseudouridine38-40 synthase